MTYRFLVAAALLLAYCAIKKVPPPTKKDLPLFALSGLAGIFLYMWAFNTGTDLVPSGISSFIIASVPVFTLILSIVFLKEKSGPAIWIGVLISFGGIGIIAATQITEMQLNLGIPLLLGAAVSGSIFITLQKHLLQKYTAIQATAYSVAFGTAFSLVFLPGMVGELPAASPSAHIVVIYLGLFPAAIAYLLWGYALAKTEKTAYVTSFLYLSPFLASIMAFIWLGETMPLLAVIGGIVVVVGMIITNVLKITGKSRRLGDPE